MHINADKFLSEPSSTLISVIVLSHPHPSPPHVPYPFFPLYHLHSPHFIPSALYSPRQTFTLSLPLCPHFLSLPLQAFLTRVQGQLNYCNNALQVCMYLYIMYAACLCIQYICMYYYITGLYHIIMYYVHMYHICTCITCVRDGRYVCTYVYIMHRPCCNH